MHSQVIKNLLQQGYRSAIITKGGPVGFRDPLHAISIKYIQSNVLHIKVVFMNIISRHFLQKDKRRVWGEVLPDLCTSVPYIAYTHPNGAAQEVLYASDFIFTKKGSQPFIVEDIEKTSKMQGKWQG